MKDLLELHGRQESIVDFIQKGELVSLAILILRDPRGIEACRGILYGVAHLVGYDGKQLLVFPAKGIILR